MAYNRDITADDQMFYDTDRVLRYQVFQGSPTLEEVLANTAIPDDVTGWSLVWVLRRSAKATAILIEKSTAGGGITITGVYDADPLANTQRVLVAIDDTDTYGPVVDPVEIVKPGVYEYALKRLDPGSETILAWGSFELIQAAAWE